MANVITTKLDLDGKSFTQQLTAIRTAVGQADGAVNKLKTGFSGLQQVAQQNSGAIASAWTAAMTTFAKQSVDAFQEGALAAGEFADATGVSTREASKWISVADDFGMSADAIQSTLQRFNKTVSTGADDLAEYGVQLVRTSRGTVDANASYLQALTTIGAIEDPTKRAEAAQLAFGRSYAEVARLMNMSAEELKAQLESTSEAQIFDPSEVQKAKDFQAALDNLGDVLTDLQNTVGGELVGNLTALAGAATSVARSFEKLPGPLQEFIQGAVNPLSNLTETWNSFDRAVNGTTLDGVTSALAAYSSAAGEAAEATDAYRASLAEGPEVTAAENRRRNADAARYEAQAVAALEDRLNSYMRAVDGIPAEKLTDIRAAIAEGDLERAEVLINEVARTRVAQIVISVGATIGAKMGGVGQGAAAAAAAAAGQGVAQAYWTAYDAAHAKGSSGGGGGGSIAEEEAVSWDDAIARAYKYGEITRQNYIDYLTMRIAGEEKYTDVYDALWSARNQLEQQAAKEAQDAIDAKIKAEKEAADEAKRQADEAKRAAEAASRAQQESIINVYSNSLDPMAVARAIEQARRMLGSKFLQG